MYNEEEVEDSLEFCRIAKEYYDDFSAKENTDYKKTSFMDLDTGYSVPQKKGWKRPTSESAGLRLVNNIFVFVVCILLAYFIASVVTHYVVHQTWVEGESMEPTLSDGDSIIIQKVSYYFANPKRYDVVVFPVALEKEDSREKTYYVKRVIGMPGETVQIWNGRVYIDDRELSGDTYCLSEILDAGNAISPITLGENEYFVLGDNRNMSTDSRSDFVGLVQRENIVGKVYMRIWPFSHWGLIPE